MDFDQQMGALHAFHPSKSSFWAFYHLFPVPNRSFLPIRGMTWAIVVIEMSSKLQKGAIIDVVYFSMGKMLLY